MYAAVVARRSASMSGCAPVLETSQYVNASRRVPILPTGKGVRGRDGRREGHWEVTRSGTGDAGSRVHDPGSNSNLFPVEVLRKRRGNISENFRRKFLKEPKGHMHKIQTERDASINV